MPNPKLIPALALLLCVLGPPSVATAGTYTVHSCHTPSGAWVGTDGWSYSASLAPADRDGGAITTCLKQGQAMGVTFGDVQLPVDPGVGRAWRFDAAPSTSIATVRITRTFNIGWIVSKGQYDHPYVVDSWYDDDDAVNSMELLAPPRGASMDDGMVDPFVAATDGAWSAVNIRLRCWEANGDYLCAPFRARLRIPSATIGLIDSAAPSGWADASSLGEAVRGMGSVGYSAADEGGGVYRAIVSIDGVEVRREIVDGNGGRCRDVEPGSGGAYEFASPRPCALSASGAVAFDTRGMADGQHRLRLEVEDAGGNATVLHDGLFTTHNGPIATAGPRIDGEARVGSALRAVGGAWDGEPASVELRWLRCDGAGEGCEPIAGAIGDAYTPTAADAGRRIVVEAVARNAAGVGSDRSAPTAVVAPASDGGDGNGGGAPGGNGTGGGAGGPGTGGPGEGGAGAGGAGAGDKQGGAGGVGGLQNPLADQGGHAANGSGASAQARLSLRVRLARGGAAASARGRSSRRWTVVGRLADPSGRAIGQARVTLAARVVGRRWKAGKIVRTGADGRFAATLAAGPSRQLRATYFPFADSRRFRASNVVTIESLAPLTIRADRSRLGSRRVVTLAGRAGGVRPRRAGGLLVTLQGHQRGWGWRTFRTVRTNRRGAWRTRYRFRSSSGRFAFRAIVPRQAGYPYATTTSPAVAVRVG